MKRHALTLALVMVAVAATASTAAADQIRYIGAHPIHDDEGGYCHIEVPHVHVYAAVSPKVLYRELDGHHHFVGDPVAHGYDGDRHAYYGHHPMHPVVETAVPHAEVELYCYLDGPHFHAFAPPPTLSFELAGNAYWYVGEYPKVYHRHKKARARINKVYTEIHYDRPVVVVDARPAAYVGAIVEIETPVVEVAAPVARVEAPVAHVRSRAAVEVHIPRPVLEVEVGLPGVVIEGGGHVHVGHGHRGHYKHKKHKHKKYKHRKHKKYRKTRVRRHRDHDHDSDSD